MQLVSYLALHTFQILSWNIKFQRQVEINQCIHPYQDIIKMYLPVEFNFTHVEVIDIFHLRTMCVGYGYYAENFEHGN